MTTRTKWNIVAVALLALGVAAFVLPLLSALPWVVSPLRDSDRLEYPDRVRFTPTADGYTEARWDLGDWDRPGPCPLGVRLGDLDLGPVDLASADRLRHLGWSERAVKDGDGQVASTALASPEGVVECSYRGGRLTYVLVDAANAGGAGRVAVRLGGRAVDLPNTADRITATLGPPLAKK